MRVPHTDQEIIVDQQARTDRSNAYRIAIEPAKARVQVSVDGQVIADSTNAMRLRETHFPTHCYFPKSDISDGLLTPSTYRTFCPFKGTAHFWNLQLGSHTIKNGAWSYENPLVEAEPVGGYVAFDERVVDEIKAEPPLPATEVEPIGGCPLIEWLMLKAW